MAPSECRGSPKREPGAPIFSVAVFGLGPICSSPSPNWCERFDYFAILPVRTAALWLPIHFDKGWNRKALVALAVSGAPSIGFSLAGAFGLMFNVGDWRWLIGSASGVILYVLVNRIAAPAIGVAVRA